MPLRGRYDLASGEGDVVERSVELGERPEQVLPTRKLANQLASKGERPELTVPVVDSGCRLERLCGNIAGMDCESAVDRPYVCYDMTR